MRDFGVCGLIIHVLVFQLAIQENYRSNPFHNFRHCFCVSQMMYGMINLCNLQVRCALVCVFVTGLNSEHLSTTF